MSTEAPRSAQALRVLAADEDEHALQRTAALLEELGHDVTAFAVDVGAVAERVAEADPDVAVVVVHRDDDHALDLIAEIGSFASGPVVALLDGDDPEFVRRAAERGVDAYAGRHSPDALQSALELAMRRHAEQARLAEQVDQLEGALGRRSVIERAKGVLMERHGIDDRAAFELLRSHARARSRTVVDTARSVLDGHALPPARRDGA
ncbi:MAG TPA: ANTAR domain-containing protein [Solirubrobacteraceae bacterium]|nr:ANTAR domain-containing protein [Solirubrobacteraceae bacterium]